MTEPSYFTFTHTILSPQLVVLAALAAIVNPEGSFYSGYVRCGRRLRPVPFTAQFPYPG